MNSKQLDHDLELKLRFKRILFLQGYYSPLEVELSHYSEIEPRNRRGLTDLDVLGIKFDVVLTPHKVVGDCKSGRVSDPNRLFWLRGVSDYFGANVAYFLRPQIGVHARAIAPKLGLRTIDENELSQLEDNLDASNLVIPIADLGFHVSKTSLWGINVSKGQKPTERQMRKKELYQYLSYTYWYVDANRNLFMLIERCQQIADLLSPKDPADVQLAYSALERFALCLMETGNFVYSRGLSEIPKHVRAYLYGGSIALRERQQLFAELQKLRLPGLEKQLDPEYLDDVTELIYRVISHPHSASKILQYLEAIYDWCVLLGKQDLSEVFSPQLDIGSIVLSRDVCITFCKATGLNEELFGVLLNL